MTAPAQPEQAPQLSAGSRLGRYEIVAPLGAGGMGEVWRARDARLGREVAIKVLPRRLTADSLALQRFEREARAVAALSHPNILAIHDFERDGETHYAVTELLQGESLRDLLRRGPAAPRKVREWGCQLARALAAAHDRGIVHRDVKPENVFLTKDGIVKLLDFGLARPQAGPQAETAVAGESSLTTAGMLVGTVGYMAPEQLRAEALDGRADVFALGCVLYELLTGERAFAAGSMAATINAILEHDPPRLETLAETASPELARIVRRCLEKRREQRFQSAHDLAFALEGSSAATSGAVPTAAQPAAILVPPRRRWWLVAAFAMAAALFVLAGVALERRRTRVAPPSPVHARLSLASLDDLRLDYSSLALSPDGRTLAFALLERGEMHVWVRSLVTDEARPLADTDGGRYPFWSPDSRHLGFFARGKLKRIPLAGGPATTLATAPDGRGGTWSEDDTIVFAPATSGGLQRISAAGGAAETLTTPAAPASAHQLPRFLPGGRRLLFVVYNEKDGNGVYTLDLATRTSRRLLPDVSSALFAHGHLLYPRDGSLVAQPFEPAAGALHGAAVMVAPALLRTFSPATANERLLAYLVEPEGKTVLTWVDEKGRRLDTVGEPDAWTAVSLSPDGAQAVVLRDGRTAPELWHVDLGEGVFRRLASDVLSYYVAWAPSGEALAVVRGPLTGPFELVVFGLRDGSQRVIDRSPLSSAVSGWAPDGTILFTRGGDVWTVAADGTRPARPLAVTPAREAGPRVSADGRWVAFASNETGRLELYVAPFPTLAPRRQLSLDGSLAGGVWSEGALLFMDAKLQAHRVAIEQRGGETHFGRPTRTFPGLAMGDYFDFDFARDGRRLLTLVPVRKERVQLQLVVDWPALLERER